MVVLSYPIIEPIQISIGYHKSSNAPLSCLVFNSGSFQDWEAIFLSTSAIFELTALFFAVLLTLSFISSSLLSFSWFFSIQLSSGINTFILLEWQWYGW